MTYTSSKIIINTSADVIWQVLSDFGAACQYLTMVVDCRVVGEGVGALRTLTYADGSLIIERLETLDAAAHRLSYSLLTDTPFRHCLTTIVARNLGPSQAELAWSATFEADGIPACEAQEMLEGVFELNGRALQQFTAASTS